MAGRDKEAIKNGLGRISDLIYREHRASHSGRFVRALDERKKLVQQARDAGATDKEIKQAIDRGIA